MFSSWMYIGAAIYYGLIGLVALFSVKNGVRIYIAASTAFSTLLLLHPAGIV